MSKLSAVPDLAPRDAYRWNIHSSTFVSPDEEPGTITVTPTSAPFKVTAPEPDPNLPGYYDEHGLNYVPANGQGENVIEIGCWTPGDADRPSATVLLTEKQARELQTSIERAIRVNAAHTVDRAPDMTIEPDAVDTLKYLVATVLNDLDYAEDVVYGQQCGDEHEGVEAAFRAIRNRLVESLSGHCDPSEPTAHGFYRDGTPVETRNTVEDGVTRVYHHKPGSLR